jgi:hypothetical protein
LEQTAALQGARRPLQYAEAATKRFLNFLERHGCEVPFQPFRTVKVSPQDDATGNRMHPNDGRK